MAWKAATLSTFLGLNGSFFFLVLLELLVRGLDVGIGPFLGSFLYSLWSKPLRCWPKLQDETATSGGKRSKAVS